jgi:thiol-disulfide isomerase/thioredoxin
MFPHNQSVSRAFVAAFLIAMLPVASLATWKEGDPLPDLTTFELEGKLPDNLKGQVILLDFWASWCGPCKASFPAMEALHKEHAAKGLTIIAVSVDEKAQHMQAFLKSANPSFPTLRDAKHKLVSAADIRTMPTSVLIDRAGKVRFVHAGFDREKTAREYAREIEQVLKEPKP